MQWKIFLIVMSKIFTDRHSLSILTHAFVQSKTWMISILIRIIIDISIIFIITGKWKCCRCWTWLKLFKWFFAKEYYTCSRSLFFQLSFSIWMSFKALDRWYRWNEYLKSWKKYTYTSWIDCERPNRLNRIFECFYVTSVHDRSVIEWIDKKKEGK